jgi:septal ring-binding cell division protein DamX
MLAAKGFGSYIFPTQFNAKTWYRVRVGHFATLAQAEAVDFKLRKEVSVPAAPLKSGVQIDAPDAAAYVASKRIRAL